MSLCFVFCFCLVVKLSKHCKMVSFWRFMETISFTFRSKPLSNNNIPPKQPLMTGKCCCHCESLVGEKYSVWPTFARNFKKAVEEQMARQRRRFRRGGVRRRFQKRGNKPPLPALILCNTLSLRNKMDKLKLYNRIWYEAHSDMSLEFCKTGTLWDIYINNKWCRQYTTRETISNPDAELLCLNLRLFFLPWEWQLCDLCCL